MAEKVLLNVEGMTCSNCAKGISKFLEKQGLENIRVDFSSGEVTFKEVPQSRISEVKKGINKLGYHVNEEELLVNNKAHYFRSIEFKFIFCALFTLPLVAHMILPLPVLHIPMVQLFLCLPVFVVGLLHFGRSALASLKTGVPNMDVLIITGSSAAFFYSVAGMFLPNKTGVENYMFFETAATIITLVLLGNLIEKKTIRKTTSAITDLIALQPAFANKIIIAKDLTEMVTVVSTKEIKKHDAVLVNSGGVIPVDGKIYFGTAAVDESTLTGESVPVEKIKGDNVLAGSIILNGSIKIVTEKVGNTTVLSQIIELVKDAQQSKPAIQKLGDKISAWFVPVVISISILTFLIANYFFHFGFSHSLMNAIAVLVISCPCAMGLATPTAVAVGLGKAARNGIIVKGGAALEMFGDLKTVVFDKTGTLTTGKFSITAINILNGSRQEIINAIFSLEQHANHPLAIAISNNLREQVNKTILFSTIEEEKGTGIKALGVDGISYSIGSFNAHKHLTSDENHQVYFAVNNILTATIDLKDEIREGAAELMQWLHSKKINPVMLSGDNEKRCREVADSIGITTVYSNQFPHQKTEIINKLKSGGRVMMIGDGINDAPALASADIGVSFGEASQIAINTADVVLIGKNNLLTVKDAITTGSLTLSTIRQNLFWAFFYNIVAIPVAAMGFLSPMVAALSMAFSDVIVIGNSIRLRFRK